jgi:pimeloyl-ACP methyl ester carboxylesterase
MKPHLLCLHGAIGASAQLKAIASALSDQYTVHLYDFPGHGGKALPDAPFSIPLFSSALADHIQALSIDDLTIFGFSMGGFVALHMAKQHPHLVKRIITLGTKFHWDTPTAEKEIKMLQPEIIEAKVPKFTAALKAMHAPNDWKEVLARTAAMMLEMGKDNPLKEEDYKEITTPTLILQGDRDKMVTFEETIRTYKQLGDAQLGILPNTQHPVEMVNTALLVTLMKNNQGENAYLHSR